MSNTRTVTSPGVFAEDAVTVIPPTPSSGVAYRDPSTTQQDSEDGWRYNTRVDSSKFNQIMHDVTALLKILDTRGVLGWNSSIPYAAGALVLGSDGVLYQAQSASTNTDPVLGGSAWARIGAAAATAAEVTAGTVANKYVSPATLINLLAGSNMAANGFVKLPFKNGSLRAELILQWMNVTTGGQNSVVTVNWPTPFPSACFFAFFAQNDVYGSGQSIETLGLVSAKTQTSVSVVNRAVGDSAVGVQALTGTVFAVGW